MGERQSLGYLENYDILGELHGTYSPGLRLDDQIFTLKDILTDYPATLSKKCRC